MPETHNREVNTEIDVIDADTIDDNSPDDGDETVIPPVEEDGETEDTAPIEEETTDAEEPSDTSPEGTDQEEEAEEAEPEAPADADDPLDPSHDPRPVAGETPREKGLRIQIVNLRRDLRTERARKAFTPGETPTVSKELQTRIDKLKNIYTPEELANMEDAIDVLAQKKGYVKKEESYQETVSTEVNLFVEQNPEYKLENDKDDLRWNKFQEILKSGIYNLNGKTPTQIKAIFKRVNQDVIEELGAPNAAASTRKVAAQQQKVRSVHGGGGTRPSVERTPTKKPAVDPGVRGLFKGFDDEDLAP